MRLGEILVAASVLTVEQVDEALRAQVMWGGRLGTNLVELGYLDLDTLSSALGRQAGLPAALASHFARADQALQLMLTVDIAERFQCVPLLRAGKRIVIAASQPLDDRAIALVADDLVIDPDRIVPSIAAELRVSFQLERVYAIPRPQRFLRSRNATSHSQLFQISPTVDPIYDFSPPKKPRALTSRGESDVVPEESALLFDEPGDHPEIAPASGEQERRTYLKTLADLLNRHPDRDSVVARVQRIATTDALRRRDSSSPTLSLSETGEHVGTTIADAIDAIHRSADREQLARRAILSVARFVEASRSALLLVVRGEAAVSWTGFCRDGTDLPPLAVPLDRPGLVPAAIQRKTVSRGASGNLGAVDYLLLASLGVPYGDLAVCPIAIGDHVMSMVVIAIERDAPVEHAAEISAAAAIAFARLMRDAGR